jgi:hypothetical protein
MSNKHSKDMPKDEFPVHALIGPGRECRRRSQKPEPFIIVSNTMEFQGGNNRDFVL